MRFRITVALAALLGTSPFTSASAQSVATGFGVDPLPDPGGLVRTLSTGEFVTWDGQFVRRYAADGSSSILLHDFGTFAFTGAFAIDPTESFAVVGESSEGDMHRVDLTAGGATFLVQLAFNYDAAFAPDGWLAVSAASTSFVQNDVYRVDPVTGDEAIVAEVPGASGPLDFDLFGNLIYATSSAVFPAPLGSTDVLRFAKADIDALGPTESLGADDASLVASGFDGSGSLVVDRATFRIYMTENNFGTGVNRVREVISSPLDSPILYEGPPFATVDIEGYAQGSGGAIFARFQPEFGGTLQLSATDFASFDDRLALHPERPVLSLDGPGTTGVGPFVLTQTGGLEGGTNILVYGPASLVGPEQPLLIFALPLFTGLDVPTLKILPYAVVSDGAGTVTLPLYNVSGAVGLTAIQLLLLDESGLALATGTSAVL